MNIDIVHTAGNALAVAVLLSLPVAVAADKAPVRPPLDAHSTACTAKCWYQPPFTEQERKTFFRIGGNLVYL